MPHDASSSPSYGTVPQDDVSVERLTFGVREETTYRVRKHHHSWLYKTLHDQKSVAFNRALATLILLNVVVDVMITVKHVAEKYQREFELVETVSSMLFMSEYVARLVAAGERLKYSGLDGRLRFMVTKESLIDLLAFAPWVLEMSTQAFNSPPTSSIRVLRLLRILKTERFTGAVGVIVRVVGMNAPILGVATMMAAILLLLTSTLLYYAALSTGSYSSSDDFSSIPATMYLSVLMLTGQGEPEGVLSGPMKAVCVFTALFSVAMVAIPASMLTFGFEIEATRLVKKRRERRLRRKLRVELHDPNISTTSGSESEDAKEIRRAERRQRRQAARLRAHRKAVTKTVSTCFSSARREETLLNGRMPAAARKASVLYNDDDVTSLESTEAEYEELVLGKPEAEAYEELKATLKEAAYRHFLEDTRSKRFKSYAHLAVKIREAEGLEAPADEAPIPPLRDLPPIERQRPTPP